MINRSIRKVWQDFLSRPFPDGCAGTEVEGIELSALDSFTAGCIDTFVANDGQLDAERLLILKKNAEDLELVIPKLEGDAIDYFEQLQLVSNEVLRVVSKRGGH
jgi:hypothetical protein